MEDDNEDIKELKIKVLKLTLENNKLKHILSRRNYDKLQKYPNAGKSWSEEDDTELKSLVSKNKTTEEIAVLLQRTHGSIVSRIKKLNL